MQGQRGGVGTALRPHLARVVFESGGSAEYGVLATAGSEDYQERGHGRRDPAGGNVHIWRCKLEELFGYL